MATKIARQELINELHRLANELDKTPTRVEMNDHGKYSRSPYDTEFGGWNKALEAAGFEINKPIKLSREQLLRELERVSEVLGKSPTMEEFREHSKYSERAYKTKFGTWNDALRAAELEPNKEHAIEYPTLACEYCGDEYQIRPSKADNSRFCSNECKDNIKQAWTGKENPHPNAGKRVMVECEWCESDIYVHPSEVEKTRFCDRECLGNHHREVRSGEDSPRWNGGTVEWRGPNWKTQRVKAIERDDFQCVHCGMAREEHRNGYGEDLNVHHIREFASFNGDYESANNLENLVTLCKECHSLFEHLGIDEQRKMLPFSW